MAVTKVTCPSCATVLKSAQPLQPGKRIRCPKCQTVVTVPEEESSEDEAPPAKPAPAKPRPGDITKGKRPAAEKPLLPASDSEDDNSPDAEEDPNEGEDVERASKSTRKKSKRKEKKETETEPRLTHSPLGIASLVVGCVAIGPAMIPCIGFLALPVSAVGLLLGVAALIVALSGKRHKPAFAIAGLAVSAVACAMPYVWVGVADKVVKDIAKSEEELRKEVREGTSTFAKMTAKEFSDETDALQEGFCKKYVGKVVEVSGVVASSNESSTVTLYTDDKDASDKILCMFDRQDMPKGLQRGQKVTIRGAVDTFPPRCNPYLSGCIMK